MKTDYDKGYEAGWKAAKSGTTWLYYSTKSREWKTGWDEGRTDYLRSAQGAPGRTQTADPSPVCVVEVLDDAPASSYAMEVTPTF